MAGAVAESTAGRMVVCTAGGVRFALAVGAVREVCTGVTSVKVPGVAAPVEGVANIRGTLVTIVRAAHLLGAEAASAPSAWFVVLSGYGGRVGLGVDDVIDLEQADPAVVPFDVDGALEPVFGRPGS